jgi:polysaccharide export outer membrane protein
MNKTIAKYSSLVLSVLALLAMTGCTAPVSTDQIIQVETVQDSSQVVGIKESEREMISRLRVGARQGAPGSELQDISSTTQKLTVEEYLGRFDEPLETSEEDYAVGGNDVLTILVYDEPDLSRSNIRVTRDGTISFPLLGRLQVGGQSISQIEEFISRQLAEGQFLLDAQVTVLINKYGSKKYQVLGEIRKPGSYPLKAEERLLDAISAAGGVDPETAGKEVIIVRTLKPLVPAETFGTVSAAADDPLWGRSPSFTGAGDSEHRPTQLVITVELDRLLRGNDLISNLYLHDNDVIYLPKAEFFYIMGEVKSPGSYKFTQKNLTLIGAIGTAGGFSNIAARKKTRIIRVEDGVEKIITVNVDAITSAGRKIQDIEIRPNDIIIVPQSFF